MIRVLLLFALTVGSLGLIAFTAWHPELWEPWLESNGITRDDQVFRTGLKAILAVVLGVPLTALIFAIRNLGSDRSQRDIHGYTVLRVKTGTRWFTVISCLGLAALFFTYPMIDPAAPYPWAFWAAGTLCLVFIPVILNAKVRYDDSTLLVSNSFPAKTVHHWSDLSSIRDVPEMKHYLFTFKNGKKATVSYSYAGVGALLETAKSKLTAHGGHAARSRH
jgi:hypothetical protein